MTLQAGTRFGPYEILAPLGAGGMGEVYRARDSRLERTVAVKILPPRFDQNPEMKLRFEREAKAISSLAHPNICVLHDVGEQDGVAYLVMEFLEGTTLADRLAQGPLPLDQVFRIGIEVAAALEAAHHAGIVHRDLKPGNIMLTRTGVKLLDFGLARTGLALRSGSSPSLQATETLHGMTQEGTILGTLNYMAPEQLEGRESDARSDLFALGAVLYELVSGQRPFAGGSQAALISAILKDAPKPLANLAPLTPPALDRLVLTCLAKDPEERFQTAHDLRLQLQWLAEGGSQAGLPAPVAVRRRHRERLAWILAGAAGFAALALGAGFLLRAPQRTRQIRFEIPNPPDLTTLGPPRLAPDGLRLAFNATDASGRTQIWIRQLNALTAQPLAGTLGAGRPFWSPDSRFLGFMADGKLMKIDVTGGPPQKICDAPGGADGSWGSGGVILFDGSDVMPIQRVPASGGVPALAVKADRDRKETTVAWPEFLPDGRHFTYLALHVKADEAVNRIACLDSAENRQLAPGQTAAVYAAPGFLLMGRDHTLVAQPFNASSLKFTGEPVPLAEHLPTDESGLAKFSASRDGLLVYQTGEAGTRFLVVDRGGKEVETLGEPGDYANPAYAPGRDRLAYDAVDPRTRTRDLWIRDVKRGVKSRFTLGAGGAGFPLWSPDGRRIVYTKGKDLYVKDVDGQGQPQLLLTSGDLLIACDWSRDGRYLAYLDQAKDTAWDIWILPMTGEPKPFPFLKTASNEMLPRFSPDGRFMAFISDESGSYEVYVQSFPGPGGKWQISANGGFEPVWRADGKELYFWDKDRNLTAVDVEAGPGGPRFGANRTLFRARFGTTNGRNRYLPSADGKQFLTVAPLGRDAMVPTTVVVGWNADLK